MKAAIVPKYRAIFNCGTGLRGEGFHQRVVLASRSRVRWDSAYKGWYFSPNGTDLQWVMHRGPPMAENSWNGTSGLPASPRLV